MKLTRLMLALIYFCPCYGGTDNPSRQDAEYYVTVYARHYGVPIGFVRALVEQESGWHSCAVSQKGAAGLMQLMPETARRLNVQNRCNVRQNVSGGVRHLAHLMARFHGDLRLVAAAYYAGERVIEKRGLRYANPDVVHYVTSIRERVDRQNRFRSAILQPIPRRTE
ncbi:MAG: lytic transglycosylase domain-containing protein [Candidatus Angelobacter sp.]